MPKFTGKRQARWYQAQATVRAIYHYLETGNLQSDAWTVNKMFRMTYLITGIAFEEDELNRAAAALEAYLETEIEEDAVKHLPPILAYIVKAWRLVR